MDIRDLLLNSDRRAGEYRLEFRVSMERLIKWLKGRKEKEIVYEWVYDGCDCVPAVGARSIPYCEEHWNPLIRRERRE